MDKTGHFVTSYYLGLLGYKSLRWAGLDKNRSLIYGGSCGLIYLTSIEILDGFSEGWGFSIGDMAANISGTGIFIAQEHFFEKQYIIAKYSYKKSIYTKNDTSSFLGKTFLENTLKDYNGQTYWLSIDINSITNRKILPYYMNIAIGYSAEGMYRAEKKYDNLYGTSRYRQYFISFDIDITKIKTKNKLIKTVTKCFAFIKIPFPTIEFNNSRNKNIKFYWLYPN